ANRVTSRDLVGVERPSAVKAQSTEREELRGRTDRAHAHALGRQQDARLDRTHRSHRTYEAECSAQGFRVAEGERRRRARCCFTDGTDGNEIDAERRPTVQDLRARAAGDREEGDGGGGARGEAGCGA